MPSEREINERLGKVAGRLRLNSMRGSRVGRWVGETVFLEGLFSATQLRELANAIDLQDDATAAMIHDLQQESEAYQRGKVAGVAEFMAIWEGINIMPQRGRIWVLPGGIAYPGDGEQIRLTNLPDGSDPIADMGAQDASSGDNMTFR